MSKYGNRSAEDVAKESITVALQLARAEAYQDAAAQCMSIGYSAQHAGDSATQKAFHELANRFRENARERRKKVDADE